MRVVIDILKRTDPAYMQNWRNRNRRKLLLKGARDRSRWRNIDLSIELEDIPEIPDVCPILEITLKVHVGEPGWHDDSPSLDRIVNSKGYIKGNVRIISNRANRLKADASIEELRKVYEDAVKCTS